MSRGQNFNKGRPNAASIQTAAANASTLGMRAPLAAAPLAAAPLVRPGAELGAEFGQCIPACGRQRGAF